MINQIHPEERWDSFTVKTKTPNGTMFVTIMESNDSGKPIQILIHVGKAGSDIAAWADCAARLINLHLKKHGDIYDIIFDLTNLTTGKFVLDGTSNIKIRSGPEGLAYALIKYVRMKKLLNKLQERRGLSWDHESARV